MTRDGLVMRALSCALLTTLVTSALVVACGSNSSTRAGTGGGSRATFAAGGCSTAVASAPARLAVRTAFESLPGAGAPFGIATTADGRWSFIDEVGGQVVVFSDAGFLPHAVSTIALPRGAVGNSLTRDGRYLLVADGADGASVVRVAGARSAVVGTLRMPGHASLRPAGNPGDPRAR